MNDTVPKNDAAELLQILDEQAALFEQWLALDEVKREALLQLDREQLEDTVRRQTHVLVQLDGTEKRRQDSIARGFSDQPDQTLSALTDLVYQEQREPLIARETRLKHLLERVEASNALSNALLQQAVAHNQVVLDALLGRSDVPATYGPPGRRTSGKGQVQVAEGKARRINEQA